MRSAPAMFYLSSPVPSDVLERVKKEIKQTMQGRDGRKKERKKTDNPREGWEDGTSPPHRDFKERGVMR